MKKIVDISGHTGHEIDIYVADHTGNSVTLTLVIESSMGMKAHYAERYLVTLLDYANDRKGAIIERPMIEGQKKADLLITAINLAVITLRHIGIERACVEDYPIFKDARADKNLVQAYVHQLETMGFKLTRKGAPVNYYTAELSDVTLGGCEIPDYNFDYVTGLGKQTEN